MESLTPFPKCKPARAFSPSDTSVFSSTRLHFPTAGFSCPVCPRSHVALGNVVVPATESDEMASRRLLRRGERSEANCTASARRFLRRGVDSISDHPHFSVPSSKRSFADQRVPKCNLGTRRKVSATGLSSQPERSPAETKSLSACVRTTSARNRALSPCGSIASGGGRSASDPGRTLSAPSRNPSAPSRKASGSSSNQLSLRHLREMTTFCPLFTIFAVH